MTDHHVPPDGVSLDQQAQNQPGSNRKGRNHDIFDFKWFRIIGTLSFLFLVGIVGFILIRDGGSFLAGIAEWIAELWDGATMFLNDFKGFSKFVQLLLTAGFIGLILYFLEKIRRHNG